MRTILITIVIVASISPAALAGLEITVPDLLISDGDTTGSFEVFFTTDETYSLSTYQIEIDLLPGSSGITFTGATRTTSPEHPDFMPIAGNFDDSLGPNGTTITAGNTVFFPEDGTPPALFDNAGLFKVNFEIDRQTLGAPPYPIFQVAVNTGQSILVDGSDNALVYGPAEDYTVRDGVIQVERTGPHKLQVKLREKVGGGEGNWGDEDTTLILTYGENGVSVARNDPNTGGIGDESTGWGNEKFGETVTGEYGVYSRGTPFGSGDDMLVRDARPLNDTSNVLIEAYTNKVFDDPIAWVVGETWNEGGTLDFEVLSDDKTYFDKFQIVQKEPGRFLDQAGVDTTLGSFMVNGIGSLDFDRIGCDWIGDTEVDWWIGPFAGFDLIPVLPDDTAGTPWSGLNGPLSVEQGTIAMGHPHTPEPSTLMVLAIAGFGVCARRRKVRKGQG